MLAPGPRVGIFRKTFVFLDMVGKGEDDRPRVEARHRLNDFAQEQFAHRTDSDEGRRGAGPWSVAPPDMDEEADHHESDHEELV